MTVTLIILILTVAGFVVGRPRADVVALAALTSLLVTGILTPQEALSGFSNPVVVMMAGLFVVGSSLLQTGIAKAASRSILLLSHGRETLTLALMVMVTAAIGAFVSNTGTVALMMPIAIAMSHEAGQAPSRVLMPIAFASSIGGMMTLIGTPPNMVIDETLTAHGYEPLGFFAFLPLGMISLAIGMAVMIPLSRALVRKGGSARGGREEKSAESLAAEYSIGKGVEVYAVGRDSLLAGRTASETDIRRRYGVSILEIRHRSQPRRFLTSGRRQSMPMQDKVIQVSDLLYLQGDKDMIERMARETGLRRRKQAAGVGFYDIGIAEIVVLPGSRLVGQRLRDSGLRERYRVSVLALRRHKEVPKECLADERLRAGDTLLVQGTWDDISTMGSDSASGWVLLGQPREMAEKVILDYKSPVAVCIMVAMVAAMVFGGDYVAPVTAVMVAALLMVMTGCLRSVGAAYKTVNWESIVLIAAMMPMATALEKTGLSAMTSEWLVTTLGDHGPVALLCGPALWCLSHDNAADILHEQHGYGGPHVAHRHECRRQLWCQSSAIPLRCCSRLEHVLRLALLHTAQRPCHAARWVHLRRLSACGPSATDSHIPGHGSCASHSVPVLRDSGRKIGNLIVNHVLLSDKRIATYHKVLPDSKINHGKSVSTCTFEIGKQPLAKPDFNRTGRTVLLAQPTNPVESGDLTV